MTDQWRAEYFLENCSSVKRMAAPELESLLAAVRAEEREGFRAVLSWILQELREPRGGQAERIRQAVGAAPEGLRGRP